MALITEDGTGLANAESLASVADADLYFSNRGEAAWAALTTAAKEQALRKATDYMQVYRQRWAGFRKTSTQALDWPRYEVPMRDTGGYGGHSYYPDETVPALVRDASFALALKTLSADLSPDIAPRVTSESVGPISVSYAAEGRQYTIYRAVDSMLEPLFKNGGANLMLVRA